MNTTWKLEFALPDEHRLFRSNKDMVAIADESGIYPEDTDDGVLFLDFTRPLRISGSAGEEVIMIPLMNNEGTPKKTTTDVATLLFLSQTYAWDILVAREDARIDTTYEVKVYR